MLVVMHTQTDCPEQLVYCEVTGCEVQVKRKDMETHEKADMLKHIRLMNARQNTTTETYRIRFPGFLGPVPPVWKSRPFNFQGYNFVLNVEEGRLRGTKNISLIRDPSSLHPGDVSFVLSVEATDLHAKGTVSTRPRHALFIAWQSERLRSAAQKTWGTLYLRLWPLQLCNSAAPLPPWRDDFDGSSLNTTFWTPEITNAAISSYLVAGGTLKVSATGSCNLDSSRSGAPLIRTDAPGGYAGNWTARFRLSSDNANNFKAGLHVFDDPGGVGYFYLGSKHWGTEEVALSRLSPYGGGGFVEAHPVKDTFVEYAIVHRGSGYYEGYFYDNNAWKYLGFYQCQYTKYIGLFASSDGAGMDAVFDYFELGYVLGECVEQTHDCDTNAACVDDTFSFTCTCNNGYQSNGGFANGTVCDDFDECTAGTHNCDGNAACTNTVSQPVSAFEVLCGTPETKTGSSTGTEPADVCNTFAGSAAVRVRVSYFPPTPQLDECKHDYDDCAMRYDHTGGSFAESAQCTDTDTSFTCGCNNGYEDWGVAFYGLSEGVYCEATKCSGQPSDPSNGLLSFNDDRNRATTGASLTFTCNSGYTLDTSATVCGGQTPVADPNGVMTPSVPPGANWITGDTVSFSCNIGFQQTGVETLTCEGVAGGGSAASEWPAHNASCERESWKAGDSVTFGCNFGLSVVGVSSRSCVGITAASSAWDSNPDPICADITPPELICPSHAVYSTDPGSSAALIWQASDIEGVSWVEAGKVTELTVTATDEAGNSVSCVISLRVRDAEAPRILCPSDVRKNETWGNGAEVSFEGVHEVIDNVYRPSEVSVSFSAPSGSRFASGANLVTLSATDPEGNTGTCTFVVSVQSCSGGAFRETETGRCKCSPGYWQDTRFASSVSSLAVAGSQQAAVVCEHCVQDASSEADSTHPSACFCKEGFYFVPDVSKGTDEQDYFFWTAGRWVSLLLLFFSRVVSSFLYTLLSFPLYSLHRRNLPRTLHLPCSCRPCVNLATCAGGVQGQIRETEGSAASRRRALRNKRERAKENGRPRRSLDTSDEENETETPSVRVYESTQHSRPIPNLGHALVQGLPTALCTILFYTSMNVAPSPEDERTHVIAIRLFLNYMSLIQASQAD
uniref:HYR domain-containing protein n=1 Tax=Chromera velia CCMP2878 TaxID=1169474 RepID=A0A0G4I8L7_9ALVE|eukprot:Cvel_1997.t1-p1 / transcript=Cvel_1997.t1 / gene=Cvel_1997 / organism=Chromera_velia_CCMP2878 / gene_product=Protein kinase C-binding protein NELL2, putative / transcript_product=Protein kinase C-binding protein NELL2, putative / location=Cvel_scaffold76:49583-66422(-) / protein_length=1125 / sequence_SO=supercontig / SO=protein_coding / is_pseudo=false